MKQKLIIALLGMLPCIGMHAQAAEESVRYITLTDNQVYAIPEKHILGEEQSDDVVTLNLTGGEEWSYNISDVVSVGTQYEGTTAKLTSFKFTHEDNDQVYADVEASITEEDGSIVVKADVPVIGKRLRPSFETSEASGLYLDGKRIVSGKDHFRFTSPIVFTLAQDNHFIYEVDDEAQTGEFVPFGQQCKVDVTYLTDHATGTYKIPTIYITFGEDTTKWDESQWIGMYTFDSEGNSIWTKEEWIEGCTFQLDGAGVWPDIDKVEDCEIRGRGNTSWSQNYMSKNPFRIKFPKKKKQSPFNLTEDRQWVFIANKQNGSMTSNSIAQKVAAMVDGEALCHMIPVDVYINGHYRGSYCFTEKIGIADNSVAIDETTGCLLELDDYYDETFRFRDDSYNLPVNVKDPDFSEEDDERIVTYEAIQESFNSLTATLKAGGDITSKIDMESWAKFWLVNDLVRNVETHHPKSCYIFNENPAEGEKWKFGPAWDFDWAFGYEESYTYFVEGADEDLFSRAASNNKAGFRFYNALRRTEAGRKAYMDEWNKFMKEDRLGELMEYIDDYTEFAQYSIQHNNDANIREKNGTDYISLAAQSKDWLTRRANYIYNNLQNSNTPDTPDTPEHYSPLITDASQLSSPFTEPSEGALEFLIDGNEYSHWHSRWSGGPVEGTHYLQIELAEPVSGTFSLYMMRRMTDNDHPSAVRITGSNTADFSSETLNILVEMPNAVSGAEAYSEEWTIENPTQYLRIEAVDCQGRYCGFRGYWHAAELQVYQTGEGRDWAEIMADRLLKLAAYPAMQSELQTAFDAYLSLPEDDENRVAVKAEVNGLYSIIQSAVKAYEQLPALIAQADSVLESNTDAELESACKAARAINAETSISVEILSAYDALKMAVAPYLKLSLPMDQWNFTMWTYIMDGVQYHLDTENGLARVRMTLQGDFRTVTSIDVPETITYNGQKYYVVAMGYSENEYDNQLKSISLPSTLKAIEGGAFNTTPMLKDIIVRAATVPVITDGWTGAEKDRVKVTVPNGSINSYRLANVWSEFLLVQQTPVEINIANAETGELEHLILEHVDYLREVNKLTIASGTLNSTDWNVLKSMTNMIELDIEGISNDYIAENQFSYSKLEAIRLPKNLREISYWSFNNSHRLSSIVLPDSVKTIHSFAFEGCNNLQEVVLNEGLELIEGHAFSSCDIRSITIPSTVKRIDNDAFAYNRNMTELNFMEGVEEIHYNAFNDCDALTEVTLPSTLLKCVHSFNSCDNLTTITSNAIVPAYTENYCPVTGSDLSKVVLKVPVWSIDDYKFAPGWSQIPVVEASEYQPETIIIRKDYTFRLKETDVDSTYRPNIVLKWSDVWSNDGHGHNRHESGNLTVYPGRKLNAKSFSMYYSPYAKYWDDRNRMNGWYDNTKYNTNSLLVKGDMNADDVTITLMNRNDRWQFVSFPFEVRMSDIVPVEANTKWVVRKYSGLERANGNMDATWVNLTANDVLEAGKGYIMHCYSDNGEPVMFQVKPNTASVTRQNIFKSADMEVALEEHVAELEHNSSWNLVGNPYPSYFDSRFMDFSAPITVWNTYENNYMAYSPVDDDYVLYPGEAFFVQRPVDQESIVFMADGRQTDIYSREMANARSYAAADRMVYNIVLKGEKASDRTRVVLNEKASMGYEMSCDASKFDAMSNEVSQIFTMVGNTRMAINERPMGNGCVELGMTIASEGVYTIALKQAGEKTVVLEDREMGVTTVLSADSEYTFSAMPGEAKGRFFLHFNGGETGINGVGAADAEKAPAFNTAGVRVEETQQGIVIKEGKKIMNK